MLARYSVAKQTHFLVHDATPSRLAPSMTSTLLLYTALVSAFGTLFLLASSFFLILVLANTRRRLHRANARHTERYARVLNTLDQMFQRRARLSQALIAVAHGDSPPSDYQDFVNNFLALITDDLRKLLTDFTGTSCSVSIKLLEIVPNHAEPQVSTVFRDSESGRERPAIYDKYEPFPLNEHSLLNRVINEEPFQAFHAFDNIRRDCPDYHNPYPQWRGLFNASAVHAITDSHNGDRIFGFLCIDNRNGGLDHESVRYIMSIACSAIFYALAAAAELAGSAQRAAILPRGGLENDSG